MRQVELRAVFVECQPDGDSRSPRRYGRALREAVGEDDALGRLNLENLADDLDASWIDDADRAADARVDGRARAPPRGPSRGVGEKAEHGFRPRADRQHPVQ